MFCCTLFSVSLLVFMPFLIWDYNGFYESTVTGIAKLPPRVDSLSLRSFILSKTNNNLSIISYACPLIILALAGKKIWENAARIETLYLFIGFTYFLIFFFSSHAFANYYYLVYLFFLNALFTSLIKCEIEPRINAT